MKLRPRDLAIIIVSGGIAMIATIVIAGALIDGGDQVDGSFVLTEPGDFTQPPPTSSVDSGSSPQPGPELNRELSSDGLVDADGRPADLSIFRGGPLVINVWYSTCAPCEAELRDFADVQQRLADSVAFVGIDPIDTVDAMQTFAAERGVEYDLWRDPDQIWVDAHGVVNYPTTLFVSADGQVVRTTGALTADELLAAIADEFGVEPS